MMKSALLLLLLTLLPASRADAIFEVPCAECDETRIGAAPASGMWRNPESSGTGFMFQIQGTLLLGTYFGYDATGRPIWYMFNGQLQRDEAPPYALRVSTVLERLEGGTCLGCPYTAPTIVRDVGSISLVFTQRSYGTFSINGSEPAGITPLVLGILVGRDFEPTFQYLYPDMGGAWSVAIDDPAIAGFWGRQGDVVQIGSKRILRNDSGEVYRTNHSIDRYDGTGPDIAGVGGIACVLIVGRLECSITYNTVYPGQVFPETLTFPVASANLTDNRIVAVHPDRGIRIEMLRIDYD